MKREDWLLAGSFSDTEDNAFRFDLADGGLHVQSKMENGVQKLVGHYDAFDPSDGFSSMLGHGYEFIRGKTWFGSSISYFEPVTIFPYMYGALFEKGLSNWLDW